jgi:hypothetical protein
MIMLGDPSVFGYFPHILYESEDPCKTNTHPPHTHTHIASLTKKHFEISQPLIYFILSCVRTHHVQQFIEIASG